MCGLVRLKQAAFNRSTVGSNPATFVIIHIEVQMKLKDPDNLKHRIGSQQWEDQMARITGRTHKQFSPKSSRIQRITTQRGTDRD